MTDGIVRKSVLRLPNLTTADIYVNYRRRGKAHLQQQDFEFIGLTDLPEASTVARHRRWHKRWRKTNVKAKIYFEPRSLGSSECLLMRNQKLQTSSAPNSKRFIEYRILNW